MVLHSKALEDLISIQCIENKTVFTKKGNIALLEVFPLNLMIRKEEDKTAVITQFQKFLNSLDFPIQIHISSTSIDLTKHFNQVEKKANDKDLAKSYSDFLKALIQTNGTNNRRFIIVVPEKDNLEIQAQVCTEKLQSIGIRIRRLEETQLLTFFQEYIRKSSPTVEEQELIIENYTHYLFAPAEILFSHDFFQVDKTFCTVLTVTGYPFAVDMGFLDRLIASSDKYDLSIHIHPAPIDFTMIRLNRELQKQQADLYADQKKGILNPSLDIKYKSTLSVLEDLQKGKQKLFDVSLYIMCKGKTKEEMTLLARKVKAELDGLMIQTSIPLFQMLPCYQSMLPLGRNAL